MDPNLYPATVALLLFVIAVLLSYLVYRPVAGNQWRDAFLNQMDVNDLLRDRNTELRADLADMASAYSRQVKRADAAEAKARAAERELL